MDNQSYELGFDNEGTIQWLLEHENSIAKCK